MKPEGALARSAAITYRSANPADALCIGTLGTQVFLETYAQDGVRAELAREVLQNFSRAAIEEQLAMPATGFVLAERSGHLVGFAQITHGARHDLVDFGRATELNRLYVHQGFMSQGIGKALLGHAEDLAAWDGAGAMWLSVWVENIRALAYYPRRGYVDAGATTYTFEDDHYANRVFVKELDPTRFSSLLA